jgi:hypothetical protein
MESNRRLAKQQYYQENKEKITAYRKAWREKNKDYKKEYHKKNRDALLLKAKEYWAKNKLKSRSTWLKNAYGITLEDYEAMKLRQNGLCAICQKALDFTRKAAYVDHCHVTRKVRGILCPRCNILIEFFDQENFDQLLNAARKYKDGKE